MSDPESGGRGTGAPATGNLLGLRDADAEERDSADIVLLGVASDTGSEGRPGAAKGPPHVRASSWTFGSYNPALGVDLLDDMAVVDGGDIETEGREPAAVLELVQKRVYELASGGQVPGLIGGTQLLTLGALRGILQAKRRAVTLIHLSAHHGLRRESEGEGGMLRRAQSERLLKPGGVLQVGVRGPAADDLESQDAYRAGFERLTVDDVRRDMRASMEAIRKIVSDTTIYLSVDLSCLDPSACPGVTRPSPGGLSSWEVQQALRALVGGDLVGFDVVGLCPRWDTSELAGVMAVNVLHEVLSAMADTRDGSRISMLSGRVGRTSA